MPSQARIRGIEELLDKSSKKLKDWVESPVRMGAAPSSSSDHPLIPPIVIQKDVPPTENVEPETGVDILAASPPIDHESDGVEFSVRTVPSQRSKPKKKEPVKGKRARSERCHSTSFGLCILTHSIFSFQSRSSEHKFFRSE